MKQKLEMCNIVPNWAARKNENLRVNPIFFSKGLKYVIQQVKPTHPRAVSAGLDHTLQGQVCVIWDWASQAVYILV